MGQKSNFYVEVRSLHSEVTGSCFVCKISFANGEKKFFLVDIGMFQEKDYMDWNERLTFNPEDLSFVLLTHNHVDHVGRLPMIYHRGCTAKTYASVGTAMALPISLEDSFKIMQEKNKKSKKVLMRPGNRNDMMKDNYYFPKLFNKEDLRRTFLNLEKVQYNRWIEPENINGVSFKFLPNAHLPGASMIWYHFILYVKRHMETRNVWKSRSRLNKTFRRLLKSGRLYYFLLSLNIELKKCSGI